MLRNIRSASAILVAVGALFSWCADSGLTLAADPREKAHSEAAALFAAIRAGDSVAVQKLLRDGADLNARNEIGDTPLMSAALQADAELLEILLRAGADVNAANPEGVTALLRAATSEEKVRLLVNQGADVRARSRMGNSAIFLAARKPGNSRTVQFLLDHGADPNATNAMSATVLMAATAADDIDTVRLLLDRKADVNGKPNPGTPGFFWGGWRTPLMWAAFLGDAPMCKLLLERGANVNDFVETGSALGQAAWGGHVEAARVLLDAGAQVDQRDLIANYTPLHWAASSERSSDALVELLLARGALVNAEGAQTVDNFLGVAQTPLMLARRRGETPITRRLIAAGAKESVGSEARELVRDQPTQPAANASIAAAIQRAVPPLSRSAENSVSTFLRHATRQDCVSCHQQQIVLPALSLAHLRHIATDRDAMRHQIELLKRSFLVGHLKLGEESHNILEVNLQTTFHPEPAIFAGYAALDLKLENEAACAQTDSMIHQLATIQYADGRWSWNLPRPPIQASDVTATALAIYAIQAYGIPARRGELDSCVQRARAWLADADVETNEERVHQLLGLCWAGEDSAALAELCVKLIGEQRADGGWGQLAGLGSDAYATGQSLYALLACGRISSDDRAAQRGIDFLLQTQLADGTWHVRTRAHPFQPPMDSGFAHGKDGWISAAGSSWAVMALATALDPQRTPPELTLAKPAEAPPAATSADDAEASAPVEFAEEVKPLLERSCVACHGGDRAKGGLAMTDRSSLLQGGNRGEPAIVPGEPDSSLLLKFVQDQVDDLEMPPLAKRDEFPALTEDEISLLRKWIRQGAKWPDGVTLQPAGR